MSEPYREALKWIERHPGTGSANGLTKLILSLWNDEAAFSFRECVRSFDGTRMNLALRIIERFLARGEDAELVEVGGRVCQLAPGIWEVGMAGYEAKNDVMRE